MSWKISGLPSRLVAFIRRSFMPATVTLVVAGASTAVWVPRATALESGAITGQVSDAATSAALADIKVNAYASVDDFTNNQQPVAWATTDATGNYTMENMPDGNYLVNFNPLTDSTRNATYYQQFYNGAPYLSSVSLTMVTVAEGATVTGIDARLTPLIATTTSLTASQNPVHSSQQVTLTAVVTPLTGGGVVVFTDNGQLLPGCAFTFFEGDMAVCTTSFSGAGTHVIKASWTGDAVYAPSDSAELALTVLPNSPTSKDQCKHGGWQTFTDPSFKNQGQCVSYVEHL